MVPAKLHKNRLRIDWDISEKRVKMMTKMPRDLWKRIVESGSEAIATVLAFLSFFVLTTFDVGIRRQKPSNGENRVFHFTLNKGYIRKAIFSSSFSARYHILKKKKKKKYWVYVAVVLVITLSLLATCPVSSSCSVTHVDGGHLLSAVSMTARIFSALATGKQCCFSVSHS